MKPIVTFGEVLARISSPSPLRFRQSVPGALNVDVGGAEANVAASLAQFGAPVRLVSVLPRHAIADSCLGFYAGLGVDVSHVLRTNEGRLGIYFYENGADQRPGRVIYDREGTSLSLAPPEAYDWAKIFDGASSLFVTGITPGLSEYAAQATAKAVTEAKRMGLLVICDLNFRRMLWNWRLGVSGGELAREIMTQIVENVDLLIANVGAANDVFGIEPKGENLFDASLDVARQLSLRFPDLTSIAMTLRENHSASHNCWGALLYDVSKQSCTAAPMRNRRYEAYEIRNIVDRVGAGDAFAAGLIFALNTPQVCAAGNAIAFATAASCLAHSIVGDVNFSSREEVETLMLGNNSGRIIR